MGIYVPQNAWIDTVIRMAQMVSHIGNLTPRDMIMLRFFALGNMSGRLTDHFEKALECRSTDPIRD
jgi:hypothetical protein